MGIPISRNGSDLPWREISQCSRGMTRSPDRIGFSARTDAASTTGMRTAANGPEAIDACRMNRRKVDMRAFLFKFRRGAKVALGYRAGRGLACIRENAAKSANFGRETDVGARPIGGLH